MKVAVTREIVAQVVIVLAATIGGWMVLVQPMIKEVAELEAKVESAGSGGPSISGDSVELAAARIAEAQREVAKIRERNAMSENSSELYGRIMALAERHGVFVQQLQPGSDVAGQAQLGVRVNEVDMTLRGRYGDVATFLDELDSVGGYLRLTRLQLTPTSDDDESIVHARVGCETLRFILDEQLAQLGKVPDDQP